MKLKACPLLVQSDTTPSWTVGGECHTRTYFSECLGEKCAGFVGGHCIRLGESTVLLPEPPKEEHNGKTDI